MSIYYNNEGELKLLAGSTLYADNPIGSILSFGGAVAPNGWFICQGQALSRIEYKDLFDVIGTSFGEGDGSTTFNIPDLRGEFLRGAGTNSHSGEGSGGSVGQHQAATNIGTHYSTNPGGINFYAPNYDYSNQDAFGQSSQGVINLNGSYVAGTTNVSIKARPTNTSVNYIIKAKHVSIPADFSNSLVGYLGQETDYNLYPWSHTRTQDGEDISQDIVIERDGWYSIDYTLSNSTDTNHTFTLRDFDALGEVHTIMRAHYDKAVTVIQSYLIPLKAGTYRYSQGGIGTLSVYMNRRDFA